MVLIYLQSVARFDDIEHEVVMSAVNIALQRIEDILSNYRMLILKLTVVHPE